MTIDTKTLDLIKRLRRTADDIGSFWERYRKKTSDPNCDKYQARFGGDSRFTVFSLKVNFCAMTGYYGHSGCSTFGRTDNELAEKHFLIALNQNAETIFESMADSMRAEAATLTGKAAEEIKALQKLLDDATEDKEAA